MKHLSTHKVQQYVDGLLSAGERFDVDQHVADCKACSKQLERWRRLVQDLDSVPELALPSDFARQIVQATFKHRLQITAAGQGLLIFAACFCAALLALFVLLLSAEETLSRAAGSAANAMRMLLGSPFDMDVGVLVGLGVLAMAGSFGLARLIGAAQRSRGLETPPATAHRH
ncbi:MAG: zf-HC2 domain-containing protein [Chloroflexota bacterium]|nr:zf-HC2 domain-containing protein [Chloroflexota bacterium]